MPVQIEHPTLEIPRFLGMLISNLINPIWRHSGLILRQCEVSSREGVSSGIFDLINDPDRPVLFTGLDAEDLILDYCAQSISDAARSGSPSASERGRFLAELKINGVTPMPAPAAPKSSPPSEPEEPREEIAKLNFYKPKIRDRNGPIDLPQSFGDALNVDLGKVETQEVTNRNGKVSRTLTRDSTITLIDRMIASLEQYRADIQCGNVQFQSDIFRDLQEIIATTAPDRNP